MKCTSCAGTGQQMITINGVGADGTPYQGVRHETCSSCGGTGEK
ncbi:hypothetical protein [Streptomyces sp. 372A]